MYSSTKLLRVKGKPTLDSHSSVLETLLVKDLKNKYEEAIDFKYTQMAFYKTGYFMLRYYLIFD